MAGSLKEHLACSRYVPSGANAVFKVFRYPKEERLPSGSVLYSSLFFVLEGSVHLVDDVFSEQAVPAGEFFLLTKGTYVKGRAAQGSLVIRCFFSKEMQLCNRFSLEQLGAFVADKATCSFATLPICERLDEFLRLTVRYLDDGLSCMHFHQGKRNELFWLLRGYYSKEDLAKLFYPLLNTDLDFRDFVVENYKKAKDVKELSALAHQSLSTFNRHFKKAFGIPAAEWIEKEKAKDLYREICITDRPFSEIADEYNFSSASYFTTFCKRHFGKTPKELREGGK